MEFANRNTERGRCNNMELKWGHVLIMKYKYNDDYTGSKETSLHVYQYVLRSWCASTCYSFVL